MTAEPKKINLFVVAGIALPLVLVVCMVLAQGLNGFTVAPPQHDALFILYNPNNTQPYRYQFQVKDGHVAVDVMATKDDHINTRQPRLYLYEVKKDNVREITLPTPTIPTPPEEGAPVQWTPLEVPELAGLKLSSYRVSPDGYSLEFNQNYSYGMLGLFGGGHYKSGYFLKKSTKRIPIPLGDDHPYYYPDYQLLGWVE
jgi:hypothetical protein